MNFLVENFPQLLLLFTQDLSSALKGISKKINQFPKLEQWVQLKSLINKIERISTREREKMKEKKSLIADLSTKLSLRGLI